MAVAPTYARRELGKELKRLREAAKRTQARVTEECGWSLSKVSRLETGNVSLTIHDLHVLAALYGISSEERENLIVLLEKTEQGPWWQSYALPVVMDEFLAHESQASKIGVANTGIIPGLLQSAPYTAAVYSASAQVPDPDRVEELVEIRTRRARILDGQASLHAILGETSLHLQTGGPAVLKRQIEHLRLLAEQPNVMIQIIPLTAQRALLSGGLIVFDFAAKNGSSVAYAEHAAGMNCYQKSHEVKRLRRDLEHLASQALDEEASKNILEVRLETL